MSKMGRELTFPIVLISKELVYFEPTPLSL